MDLLVAIRETNLSANDDEGRVSEAHLIVGQSAAGRPQIPSEALEAEPQGGHHPVRLLCVWHAPRLDT